jgi:hypothetical protein
MSPSLERRVPTDEGGGKLRTDWRTAKVGPAEGNSYGLVFALLAEGRRSGAMQVLARLAMPVRAVGREMFPGARPRR